MSAFVLNRNYELTLPTSYVDVDNEEMEYIDGGWAWWKKALVGAAIAAAGVGLIVALSYGQVWLAAKIMKTTFSLAVRKIGAAGVTAMIVGATGASGAIVAAALAFAF